MALLGSTGMTLAFVVSLISIVCLALAVRGNRKQALLSQKEAKAQLHTMSKVQLIGLMGVWLSALCLTICIVILLIGFLGDDNSIYYVARQRTNTTSSLAILFEISGVWAGRQGSLLFWAWLISIFNSLVALKAWRDYTRMLTATSKSTELENTAAQGKTPGNAKIALDSTALIISQLVLIAFLSIMVFDEGNRPFIATPAEYLGANGELTGTAAFWSMNPLLEHWAMAIHPPTLFIGYAGMTIPFAYALAALIVNDPSKNWVFRAQRYTLVSWLFLGIGIGLGAVWAYVVLGWGGYWGWDPVENASLLPWLIGVALIHSMSVYRMRDTFKGWTIICACLAFGFVIVSTFITRSGIVESVHAFDTNLVSTILFGILILVPIILGIVGLIVRRKTFFGTTAASEEAESFASKDVAFFLNNVVMVLSAFFLLYMTLSSALPTWMPYGGLSLGAETYNAIARPVGILYCFVIAVGPLFGWMKTNRKDFFRQARIPSLIALVLFVVLCVYFATTLLPTYMQTLAQGGSYAEKLISGGPFWYYALLTLLGFLTASLLVFNALFVLVRALAKRNFRVQTLGGMLSHVSIGIIVIGLIGSSMYVYERAGYMPYDEESDTAGDVFTIKDYTLSYVGNDIETLENNDTYYSLILEVTKDGVSLGEVSPSVQLVHTTQQQQLHASVISLPTEDLFVVYKGVNDEGSFSLDVRVNPLISFVWVGFGLLIVGSAIAAFGRRR